MALPGRNLDPKFPHITRNNIGVIVRKMAQADADALVAGAHVYRNAMTKELQGGYTSGDFYSGMQGVAGSVAVSDPQRDTLGGFILVGTNVHYAKYWEFGHQNLFTRKYERVEKWRPTLVSERGNILATYARTYKALMARP